MTGSRQKHSNVDYSHLEKRELLAGVYLETIGSRVNLVIDGTNKADTVEIRDLNETTVEVSFNSETSTHAKASFQRIRFLGRSGDDSFYNRTTIDASAAGHAGNDVLIGGDGNNWIQGGSGDDLIHGGDRNDMLRAGDGNDKVFGGNRHDRIFGGEGDDELNGQHGNDFIRGDAGNDVISGQLGNDRLFGDEDADKLFGGSGEDIGTGGSGNDTVNLGSDNDTAVFDAAFSAYSVTGSTGSLSVEHLKNGTNGKDNVVGAEQLKFSDGVQPAEPNTVNLATAEQESLRLLNELRTRQNISALTPTADLSAFAESWSRNMAENGFRHSTTGQRNVLLTGQRTTTTENIAFASDSTLSEREAAQRFHDTWASSSVHYRNMTDNTATEVGIGLFRTSRGWYGTLVFSDG